MSGTPQKMLEHLLETRLDGQAGPNDPFLDDFLLTHIVFMPIPMLINELANLYPFHKYNAHTHTRTRTHRNYFTYYPKRISLLRPTDILIIGCHIFARWNA